MLQDRLRAPAPGTVCKLWLALAAVWPVSFATAQTAAPGASAASSPTTALTPEERARREGDQVFRWILMHSDKPRKAAVPKDDKPATVVTRVKPPVRVAEPAVEVTANATPSAAPQRAAPPIATVAMPEAAPPPAPSPAPEPVMVSKAEMTATAAVVPPAPPAAAPDADATESLRPVSQEEPKFPVNLVRTLRTGLVQVKFTVLPDGSVAEPAVISTSNARLNPSALAAVAQWRFAPVRKPQQGVVELGFNNAE